MSTPPANNIPKEWLDPKFLEGVANAMYAGDSPVQASGKEQELLESQLGDGTPGPNSKEEDQHSSALPSVAISEIQPAEKFQPHQPGNNGSFREGSHQPVNTPDRAIPSLRAQYQTHGLYFLKEEKRPTTTPSTEKSDATATFPVETIRQDFPILHQKVHGKPLIWLDNAATTQKPRAVIDSISRYYEQNNSNVHRGVHELADRATDAYEHSREKVRDFIGANDTREIIFVRGTTEAINLVAQSYGRKYLKEKDEIVLSIMEHHANIVPWQMLCQETGAVLRVAPCNDMGEILLDDYAALLNAKTKLVALAHVSNVLGTVNPVEVMTQMAHGVGARVLIDGAQSIPHLKVNVQAINCDFFAFSGHKLFAPTGIGILYGKSDVLDMMPPWQGGGNMIQDVTFERTIYNTLPHKFEAGTGNIADAVGLGAAIEYLERIGFHSALLYESMLLGYAIRGLSGIPGLKLIGTAPHKVSVLSFVLEGISSEEVGRRLDQEGIAVRAGHHCAQPVVRRFGLESTVRPSLAFYNTLGELDTLVAAINELRRSIP